MPFHDLHDHTAECLTGGSRALMRHRDRHPIHAASGPILNIATLNQTITNTITQINIATIVAAFNSRVINLQGNSSALVNVMV